MTVGAGWLAHAQLGNEFERATSSMARSAASAPGVVTVEETVDDVDVDAVSWAQERYREAGLSLPDITVSFVLDTGICGGSRGGHLLEKGESRVFICITERGPTREFQIKRVLLHEFAHAWDHHALTDRIRSQFMAFKDFPGWSFDVPYDERASEVAAEIITWGLMDRPILLSSLEGTWSTEERLDGYRILTRSAPPHGYVWTLWAASHDIYAYKPSQIDIVKKAWDLSQDEERLTQWIEVRFTDDSKKCSGAFTTSELIDDRLHIQACAGSELELTTALFHEFTEDDRAVFRSRDSNSGSRGQRGELLELESPVPGT